MYRYLASELRAENERLAPGGSRSMRMYWTTVQVGDIVEIWMGRWEVVLGGFGWAG
jgi:hypothetical protein